MARHRRDNSIDNLPESVRQLVRNMLASKKPRFTYEKIIARVAEETKGQVRLTTSSLGRYWHGVLENELMEAERQTQATLAITDRVLATVNKYKDSPEAVRAAVMDTLDAAILANDQAIARSKPTDLMQAKAALERAENDRKKIEIRERELEAQLEKFRLEKEKAERALEKQRREEERRKVEATKALAAAEDVTDKQMYKRALGAIRKAVEG